ncbi:MAG: arylsulfatase [Armatimonadetes bacterium]|nr:arylsulfatase [Armatimonadota bacterium]
MPDTPRRPNVVLVITDDQGYGDLGCHGNPIIQTPNIDALHSQSVRLTNFHVGPTCAPTRAGLMTGRYCNCTGVWHTIGGRSLLRKDEITLGDVFRAGGYRTGMFGKWHLGDNYPFRPHDRGFDEALYHGGGGVSQTNDWWGNDYFDDIYLRNGEPEAFQGYCTDVWFSQAMDFVERNRQQPFFCYLSTNAPHSPHNVPERYARLYEGLPCERDRFYGMITNIDDNMARLRAHLRELGLERDTILIFMTDNGTANGCRLDRSGFVVDGYNAGMRGVKGWEYDGGHRVVFFLHWPGGGMDQGRDVGELAANIDVMPTLVDLCGIPGPSPENVHGISLAPLLRGEAESLPARTIVTDSQRVESPIKWKQSATMTQRWRLVNGTQLFDIQADPGQRKDIAADHPDVVEQLRGEYEKWWNIVSERFDDDPAIIIGSDNEPVSMITTHDWHNENSECAWNQGMVRQGHRCNGYWAIDVARPGRYEFELRRWPRQEDRGMTEGIPGEIVDWYTGGKALPLREARIQVGDCEASRAIGPRDKAAVFEFRLPAGLTSLQTWLVDENGEDIGAYFVYAQRVGD